MSVHSAFSAGNVAVITGAASGIGLACARRFLDMGMKVALADIERGELQAVQSELTARFGQDQVLTQVVDVAERAQLDALREKVVSELGPVSVLMNNAGTGLGAGTCERPEEWQRVLSINLWGVIHGVQAFVPHMQSSKLPGLVINTGSKQGITCPPGNAAYNVAKAGVKVFTEALEHELRNTEGARLSAYLLVPGWTQTSINSKARRDRERLAGNGGAALEAEGQKPAGAWTSEQVVDYMLDGIGKRQFYILCPDNEVTEEMDRKRILWAAGDLVERRPPLSRWHADYEAAFKEFAAK